MLKPDFSFSRFNFVPLFTFCQLYVVSWFQFDLTVSTAFLHQSSDWLGRSSPK